MSVDKMRKFIGRQVSFTGHTYNPVTHKVVSKRMVGRVNNRSVLPGSIDVEVYDEYFGYQFHSVPLGQVKFL